MKGESPKAIYLEKKKHMNTKNQKTVLQGFKNRIDLLGDRKKALQSLTGQELLAVIQALANEIQASSILNPQSSILNR